MTTFLYSVPIPPIALLPHPRSRFPGMDHEYQLLRKQDSCCSFDNTYHLLQSSLPFSFLRCLETKKSRTKSGRLLFRIIQYAISVLQSSSVTLRSLLSTNFSAIFSDRFLVTYRRLTSAV